MPTLQEIQRPIAQEMKAFEAHFREAMRSRTALLDRVMHYIVKRKGKQMRPMFTLLSARMFGPVGERSEEHTSELQSRENLVCRLLLEKKKTTKLIQSNDASRHEID